jgi:alpha-acetolactate decarboxylase
VQHNTVANVDDLKATPHVLTVDQMKKLGNFGLGTLQVNGAKVIGEVTLAYGIAYFSDISGQTKILEGHEKVYFMQIANFFSPVAIPEVIASNREGLAEDMGAFIQDTKAPSVAVLRGHFDRLTLRSVDGSAKQYKTLSEIVADQRQFEQEHSNREFILFAFNAPVGAISTIDTFAGLYIHAISTDGRLGGHASDFSGFHGSGGIMAVDPARWYVSVPDKNGPAYRTAVCGGEEDLNKSGFHMPQAALEMECSP